MSSENAFEMEIAAKVAELDAAGKDLVPAFITHEIITAHDAGLARQNEHTDFFKHYAYKGHRQDVGAYIAKVYGDRPSDQEPDSQHVLHGFEFVQTHYVIERDGSKVAVRVEHMTDIEIDARVRLLQRRGKACIAHADELARFKNLRGQQVA